MGRNEQLRRLADNRRRRLDVVGPDRFRLTDEELERSTTTAMRLAQASKSRVEAGASAGFAASA